MTTPLIEVRALCKRFPGVRALAVTHRVGALGIGDVALACAVLDALREGKSVPLPRFDKRADNRVPAAHWPRADKVDLVLFDALVVGGRAVTDRPYTERRAELARVVTPRRPVHVPDALDGTLDEALDAPANSDEPQADTAEQG